MSRTAAPTGRTRAALTASLLLAAAALTLAGCASPPAAETTTRPEAQVIQHLLELRLARSRDVSAYRLYFQDASTTPTSLAQAAAAEASATAPSIPQWDPPYVSASASGTADVVVVWRKADAFPDHAAATVFTLSRYQGRWVITGAREVATSAQTPRPLASTP